MSSIMMKLLGIRELAVLFSLICGFCTVSHDQIALLLLLGRFDL